MHATSRRAGGLLTRRSTIDHAPSLAVSGSGALTDERVARRALQVARRTALGVLGDTEAAADVAQDVAITAVRRAGSLRDPAALDAWLHRIAVQAALREARRAGRRREAERAGHDPPPRDDHELTGALALPARQRAALTLRYVHDMPDPAIARALRCRPGTVRSLLSRGRDAVRAPTAMHGCSAGFVEEVQAGGERDRVTYEQTSENWTSDGFRGRTVAPQGTIEWASRPSDALRAAGAPAAALVKPYDGDYRYGDGPLARVPFGALPEDPVALGALLEAAIRDTHWALHPSRHPRRAPGVVDEEVTRSAVILLSVGNLTSAQRAALFQLLASRPGARSLGEVTDAMGRRGVGVELGGLRVIIDPETSDILQTSEVSGPPPTDPPTPPPGVWTPPWPPPVWPVEHAEVFLSTGSVAALGDRPQ